MINAAASRALPPTLVPLLLVAALAVRADQPRQCSVAAWQEGCTALPLNLNEVRYGKALAFYRGYECRIEPVAGLSASDMDLRLEAAKVVLPMIWKQERLPFELFTNPLFLQDAAQMAVELPCPETGL